MWLVYSRKDKEGWDWKTGKVGYQKRSHKAQAEVKTLFSMNCEKNYVPLKHQVRWLVKLHWFFIISFTESMASQSSISERKLLKEQDHEE